jgi:hypothetical protein
MLMNLLVIPVTTIVIGVLSGIAIIAMFWAFSTCDEDDEYNKWD